MSAAAKVAVTNNGTRRVIIGAPAKSKGGGSLVKLDTAADSVVAAGKRFGQTHVIEGASAEAIRSSKTVEAMAAKLGVKVG